jgi:leucyl-tRNA synthetase
MVDSFTNGAETRDERRPHDEYVSREIDRIVAAAGDDYDRFRFHQVVTEIRALAQLLRQYREFETPNGEVYRRGLRVLTRLVAPLTPYLGEEMWNMLRGDGLVAHADWPDPEHPVDSYDIQRRLVRNLRADVRDIFDVANIDDAEEIEVVVAPEWKYRAYNIARTADKGDALVGEIMTDEEIQSHGSTAQSYAEELDERRQQLAPTLARDEEYDLLSRSAWLLRDEFDAEVTVRRAEGDEDRASKARPGKPAVHIS